MDSFLGKKVLVTGGAVRVGRTIADSFASRGADVAITFRSHADAAADFAARWRAVGKLAPTVNADLSDNNAIERVVHSLTETWGRLDILVHSASGFVRSPSDRFEAEHWESVLSVNLFAPLKLSTLCLPLFARSGGGKVIHILDLSAFRPWPNYLAHSVSKAGLKTLTEGLAVAWAPQNIQVNAVAPGAVLWPDDFPAQQKSREIHKTPAGDSGTPEDVAQAVLYLASGGPFLTGSCIRVDGGRLLI